MLFSADVVFDVVVVVVGGGGGGCDGSDSAGVHGWWYGGGGCDGN